MSDEIKREQAVTDWLLGAPETLHGMLERLRNAPGARSEMPYTRAVADTCRDCAADLQPIADQLQAVVERMELDAKESEGYGKYGNPLALVKERALKQYVADFQRILGTKV